MNHTIKYSVLIILILGFLVSGVVNDPAEASQELAGEQVVIFGLMAGDISSIDPMVSVMVQDRPVSRHVFGSLVRHPIGDVFGNPEPDLATKWERSSDGLTWTFHLRKGVQWHWGYGEFTSEDVVFSLNRVKNSKGSAWSVGYANFKEIKAVDKYTVRISTLKPEAYFLTKVSNYQGGFIVCKKAAEKTGDFNAAMSPTKEQIVGTGPFKFLEYKPKASITLVRNENYWEGKPVIERIVMKYIPDGQARELAMLNGEITLTRGVDDGKWIKAMRSKGLVIEGVGPLDLKILQLNTRIKPLDDIRVREAFAYGTSQQDILEKQGEEISKIATSPMPSSLPNHIDAAFHRPYNPAKARALLAEAGYPNGITIKATVSVAPWYAPKMAIFQNNLRAAGINVEMTSVDHSVYRTVSRQDRNSMVMWGDKYLVPTAWLRDMYHGESIMSSPRAATNYSNYNNPEVNKLIDSADTTFDEKLRAEALAKVQKIIAQDLPAIPVIETITTWMRQPWLDLGYTPKSNFCFFYEIGLKTRLLKH
jgi:peptide/nickel transport system substrate-binding protein